MRYALINGERLEATKGAMGRCLCCGADVIAKCGKIRISHWAHKNNEECPYSQKEPKTQWHQDWQNHFPKEWQEVRCTDEQTGEIHIADIKTPNGLVVEFQHSAIKPEERFAREKYHKNMIWVVDGTRQSNDFKRFTQSRGNMKSFLVANAKTPFSLYTVNWENEILPKSWLNATVPLYFDFRLTEANEIESENQRTLRNLIWGFFKIGNSDFAVSMPHNCFVDYVQREVIRSIEWYAIPLFQKKTIASPTISVQPASYSSKIMSRRGNLNPRMNPQQINRIKSKNPGFRF